MSAPASRFRKLWLVPLALAALTAAGLTSALVGDGAWDALSWLALAAPVFAAGSLFARR